jgi:mono/diheme cytochrome c family protein
MNSQLLNEKRMKMKLKFKFMVAVGLVLSTMTLAQAASTTDATLKKGKDLLDKSCMACHAAKFNGDPTYVYTRPDHKVHNLTQLSAQVERCSTNSNAGWFPDDEAAVVAYLNARFYKFKTN